MLGTRIALIGLMASIFCSALPPSPAEAAPQPINCTIAQGAFTALCFGSVISASPNPVVVGRSVTLTVDPASGYVFDRHTVILLKASPAAIPINLCGVGSACPFTSPKSMTVAVSAGVPTIPLMIVAENHEPFIPVTTPPARCNPTCTSAQGGNFVFVPPPTTPIVSTPPGACPASEVMQSDGKCRPRFPLVDARGTVVYRCNNLNPNLDIGYGLGVLTTHPEYCWPLDRFVEGSATDTSLRVAPASAVTKAFGPGATHVFSCNNINSSLANGYGVGVLTTHPEYCAQSPAPAAADTLLRVAPGPATSALASSGTPVYYCNNFNPRGAAYGVGVLTTHPEYCAQVPAPAGTDTLVRAQ